MKLLESSWTLEGGGDVTLYLYNTNSITPIETKVVTITSDHQEVLLNWKLDINSDWYIGYYSDGLTVTPYKRDYNNASYESTITHVYLEKTVVKNHTVTELMGFTRKRGNE